MSAVWGFKEEVRVSTEQQNHVAENCSCGCSNVSESCPFRLPDGLTRRGDINLLMLGDPGTAKSQLLKFAERCSPIGVWVHSLVLLIYCNCR